MITDAQYAEWAQSSTRHPVLMIEASHLDGTVYISDQFYCTGASDTPANVSYDVCLKQSVVVQRTLNENSVSAIRVFNDGSLNEWLDFAWVGYDIEVLIGDKSWSRSDFRSQYKGTIDSFKQLSANSFEFTSVTQLALVTDDIAVYHASGKLTPRLAGDHTSSKPAYIATVFSSRMYRIGDAALFDRGDVTVTYNGSPADITWYDSAPYFNVFYLDDHATGTGDVRFACETDQQKFKDLFADVCDFVGQDYNADNLAAYPINPDVTFCTNVNFGFDDFLDLTLETIGALKWINDEGELELYQKQIPDEVSINTVDFWIDHNDKPVIKTITTEDPVAMIQVQNPDFDHLNETTPVITETNALDLDYPYRNLSLRSYAKDSDATTEAQRLAALLSVAKRTYSITIDRITPEAFIGAIVNTRSLKDGWDDNGVGKNALVVGFTQTYKSNKSELIVWR